MPSASGIARGTPSRVSLMSTPDRSSAADSSPVRVVVIEDEPTITRAIADRLTAEGWEVSTALDGPSGVRTVAEVRPDLVVLDVMLPGFDGLEVCRRMREAGDELPILVLPDSEIERQAAAAGIPTVREAFADRAYTPEGRLVSRREEGSVLHDPAEISARVVQMATQRTVTAIDGSTISVDAESICVHGDTPGALEIARQVSAALSEAGVEQRVHCLPGLREALADGLAVDVAVVDALDDACELEAGEGDVEAEVAEVAVRPGGVAVDDLLRHRDDKPTIGLILCKTKNNVVAEYALRGYTAPIGVAEWKTAITANLPAELETSLPTVEELEAELESGTYQGDAP